MSACDLFKNCVPTCACDMELTAVDFLLALMQFLPTLHTDLIAIVDAVANEVGRKLAGILMMQLEGI